MKACGVNDANKKKLRVINRKIGAIRG